MSVVNEFFQYMPGADKRDLDTNFRIDCRHTCNILYRDDLGLNDYTFATFYHETKTLELHTQVWREKLLTYQQIPIIVDTMNKICQYAHEHFGIVPITVTYLTYWTINGEIMDLMTDKAATSYKFEPVIKSKPQPVVTFEQMAVLL